jgi:hypothetical protein
MSATGEHSAQYVAQDKSAQLWIAMFVTWGLATITMALRFYCKKLTSQKMGLDDYFIIVSYVSPTQQIVWNEESGQNLWNQTQKRLLDEYLLS